MKKRAKGRKEWQTSPRIHPPKQNTKKFKKTVAFSLEVCYNNEAVLRNPLKHVGSQLSWIECLTTNQKVVGSNPAGLTKKTRKPQWFAGFSFPKSFAHFAQICVLSALCQKLGCAGFAACKMRARKLEKLRKPKATRFRALMALLQPSVKALE